MKKKMQHCCRIFTTISIFLWFTGFMLMTPSQSTSSGGKIAFASLDGNWDLYSIHVDGSGLTRLTTLPSNEIQPAFSPYGTQIAFVSDKGGNNDIYLMNADGTDIRQLTTDPASDERPAWSPDGTRIVFISTRDGNDELYLTDLHGATTERLTSNQWVDGYPSWSPDGSHIVFVRDMDGNTDIYVMDFTTGTEKNLTNDPARDSYPAVSSTGNIAFLSNRENPEFPFYHLYVMESDGSNVVKISQDHVMWECPAWSPEGTMLAFVGSTEVDRKTTTDIYVMDAEGVEMINLTQSTAFADDPSWCCLKDPEPAIRSLLREAQQAFNTNDFKTAHNLVLQAQSIRGGQADQALSDLVEKYDSLSSASDQVEAAKMFMQQSQDEKALTLLQAARATFQVYSLPIQVAEIDAFLAEIQHRKTLQETLTAAESLLDQGKRAYEEQEYEKALELFQQARQLFESANSGKIQECDEWITKTREQLESGTCIGSSLIGFLFFALLFFQWKKLGKGSL
ncbi:MAG: PD40 domain-containing protein [Theionarchaea archaeon]|nr:PD40 domain-containing protein [Theionarchaea archaeon]